MFLISFLFWHKSLLRPSGTTF